MDRVLRNAMGKLKAAPPPNFIDSQTPPTNVSLRIIPLADLPSAIPTLANWFHQEWSTYDARSRQEIATQLEQNLHRDHLPITLLAVRDTEVLGTISLDVSDLPSHDHLTPWLASLYVHPSARGKGIATALVTHLITFAQAQGIPKVHLWTRGPTTMYEHLGWRLLTHTALASHPIQILELHL